MNRKVLIAMLLAIVSFEVKSQVAQISKEEAAVAASKWIKMKYQQNSSPTGRLQWIKDDMGNTILYEYSTDSVHVLMSGHKNCRPVIAWMQNSGSFLGDTNQLPDGLKSMLGGYIRHIRQCFSIQNQGKASEIGWDDILVDSFQFVMNRAGGVLPLIKTQWGQSASNTGYDAYAYNYYTPGVVNQCAHVPVGCGAVAVAQIMNYWQYPMVYNSVRQFDWCNMTNRLDAYSENYELHRNSVAYLMAECFDKTNTRARCDRAETSMEDLVTALQQHFGYSTEIMYQRRQGFTDDDWMRMLKENLDLRVPVIYKGEGTAKHVFICDGYGEDGAFHFNWGSEKAAYSNGTYLFLNDITPGPYNFTNNQEAIFNITPASLDQANRICDFVLNLGDFYSANPRLLQENDIFDITPRTMTTLTSASASSPAAWRTIPAGASAEYVAHEEVILEDGFEAEWGSEFEARIEPCVKCGEGRGDGSATRTLTQREDSLASDSTEATYMAPGHSEFTIHDSEFKIGLFPNPTDGPLTMETDGEVEAVVVYDAKGLPVGGWRHVGRSGRSLQLDVAALRPGAYILAVRTAAGTSTARFVRR